MTSERLLLPGESEPLVDPRLAGVLGLLLLAVLLAWGALRLHDAEIAVDGLRRDLEQHRLNCRKEEPLGNPVQ